MSSHGIAVSLLLNPSFPCNGGTALNGYPCSHDNFNHGLTREKTIYIKLVMGIIGGW